MSKKLYAADGVNVADEATFSSYAGSVCKESYHNSPFVEVVDLSKGQFRGPRPVRFKNLPEGFLIEGTTDSIGTKGIINDAADMPETSAYDLVAMTASDITRFGGVPLVFINILDVPGVGEEGTSENNFYKKLLAGLGEAAKVDNLIALKGETAQMPIMENKYNWGATVIGAYHADKMVTGDTVAPGQKVIAIKETGFRCNGFSSVRKAFEIKYGENWQDNPEAKDDLRAAAAPSVLVDVFINTIHGWYAYEQNWKPEVTLHAIVHLSGGGIKEKFANDLILPRGLSATLDDLWEPSEIMRKCADWRGIKDEEFYEVWNGGQGMLLVVDEAEADQCVARAAEFGLQAQICGTIEKEDNSTVTINSKLSGKEVVYS